MTGFEKNGMRRRALLAGAVGLGAAVALPAGAALAASGPADGESMRRYPANWPDLQPYGAADTRLDLWPRDDNSFILPLELRPRDKDRGVVWIRDFYVNCFQDGGAPVYVATGTTRAPGLDIAAPWNDGIFLWTAPSLKGPWRLIDTTGLRPDAEKGKVWSPEFTGENTSTRTVVAPWQEYWYDDMFGKRGEVWAPEVHRFNGKWYIVACMGDHSQKVGSFMLVSEGGLEGPYRLIEGNVDKPFGDSFIGGPAFIKPGAYFHIDGSFFSEGDDAYLVLHNDLYSRFRPDMEDIVTTTNLPVFAQAHYTPEPYREGVYVFKHGGKYFLSQAVWDRQWTGTDGTTQYAYNKLGAGTAQYQYDAVLAVADTFEGPYTVRWTAGVGLGHNNFFTDRSGALWSTFFRNPNQGYWADPSRVAQGAVPGIVRMEWTGPEGNRVYVERRNQGRTING
jgi:hypothetical protein